MPVKRAAALARNDSVKVREHAGRTAVGRRFSNSRDAAGAWDGFGMTTRRVSRPGAGAASSACTRGDVAIGAVTLKISGVRRPIVIRRGNDPRQGLDETKDHAPKHEGSCGHSTISSGIAFPGTQNLVRFPISQYPRQSSLAWHAPAVKVNSNRKFATWRARCESALYGNRRR